MSLCLLAVGPPKAAPRQALKKLLDRIRSQRSLWTERSSSAAVFTDQIPERDTTIETGSLITEDTRVELREAAGQLRNQLFMFNRTTDIMSHIQTLQSYIGVPALSHVIRE